MGYEMIREAQLELHKNTLAYWLENDFLSLNWWFLLIACFVFIIGWLIIVDKSRLMEISVYGLLIGFSAGMMDTIGFSLGFWGYPTKLVPVNPPLFPVDFIYLPVIYMLILQFFRKWKSFVIANIIAAFLYAWVGEPIYRWLDIYIIYSWKMSYSIPIYIAMSLFFKWLTERFIVVQRIQDKEKAKPKLSKVIPFFFIIPSIAALSGLFFRKSKKKK